MSTKLERPFTQRQRQGTEFWQANISGTGIKSNSDYDPGLQSNVKSQALSEHKKICDINNCAIDLATFNTPQHLLSRAGLMRLILRNMAEPDREFNDGECRVEAARYGGDEFIIFLQFRNNDTTHSFYQLCDVSNFKLASDVDKDGINGDMLAKIVAKTIQDGIYNFLNIKTALNLCDEQNVPPSSVDNNPTPFNIAQSAFKFIFESIQQKLSKINYLYKKDDKVVVAPIEMPVPGPESIVEMFSEIPDYKDNNLLLISDECFMQFIRYELLLLGSLPTYEEMDGVYSPGNNLDENKRKRDAVLAKFAEMRRNKAEMERFATESVMFSDYSDEIEIDLYSDPLFGFPVQDKTEFHNQVEDWVKTGYKVHFLSIEAKGLKYVNSVLGYLEGNVFLQGVGFQLLKILKEINLPMSMFRIARRGSSFMIAIVDMDSDPDVAQLETVDAGEPLVNADVALVKELMKKVTLSPFAGYPELPIGAGYAHLDALNSLPYSNFKINLSSVYTASEESYFERLVDQIDVNYFSRVLNEAYKIVTGDRDHSKSIKFLFFTHQLVKPQSESESKFVYAVLFMIKRLGNAEGFLNALKKKKSQQDKKPSDGTDWDDIIKKYTAVYEFMKKEASKKESIAVEQ